MKRQTFFAGLVLTVLAVTSLAGPVAAGEYVPFKGMLVGDDQLVVPPPIATIDSIGYGEATQLGRFAYELLATVDFRFPPPQSEGFMTLTAANGDTLCAEIEGTSTPVIPGLVVSVIEEATIVGGTGRFAGASGSFLIERLVYQDTRLTTGTFEGVVSIPGNRQAIPPVRGKSVRIAPHHFSITAALGLCAACDVFQ